MRGTLIPNTLALSACHRLGHEGLGGKHQHQRDGEGAHIGQGDGHACNIEQRVGEQAGEGVGFGAVASAQAVAHGNRQADGGDHDGHHAELEQRVHQTALEYPAQ
jgi:hypothetical protein